MSPLDAAQSESLLAARACSPSVARLLGLLFANRDLEMIDLLNASIDLPAAKDFPSAETVVAALHIEKRWADFQLEKMQRFLHKRKMNGDYSADIHHFTTRHDVAALAPACRTLRPGPTVFIGDSLMATKHFAANAPFPNLAGPFLESLDRGPFINAGIGGQTSTQGLARFATDVLAHHPVRIILSFGSNDLSNNAPLEKILANFQAMITQAHAIRADLVLGLLLPTIADRLWWSPKPFRAASLEERLPLHTAMLALARRHHLPCFDLLTQFAPAHYCVDGIHINQSGQELLALETLRLLTR